MISKKETFIVSALAVALVGGGFAVGHESQRLTARADGQATAPHPHLNPVLCHRLLISRRGSRRQWSISK